MLIQLAMIVNGRKGIQIGDMRDETREQSHDGGSRRDLVNFTYFSGDRQSMR